MNAVAYIRVSTEEQAREGRASLPAQRARLEAYATEHGLTVVGWYEDAGVSAYDATANREGFNAAIGRSLAGDVQAFLVLDLSRFYRDAYEAAHYIRLLQAAGVTLRPVAQQHDATTPEGELLQWLNMGLAQLESRQNAQRVIRAQMQNLEMRDPETGWAYQNGGQPLFGYTALRVPAGRNRKGQQAYKQVWVLDETEAAGRKRHEWARELLERRMAGASYDELARWLTAEGVPPIRGKFWPRSTCNYLLKKAALLKYAGNAVWNVHDNRGREKPEDEWAIIEHGQPALISGPELEKLLKLGQRQRYEYQKPNTPASYPSPWQGRFFCARCGSRMSLYRQKPTTPWYYLCASKKYGPVSCGPVKYLRREEAEVGTFRWLADFLGYPHELERRAKECELRLRNLSATASRELAALSKRRRELEGEIDRWLEGADPTSSIWPDVERRLIACRTEINELEKKAAALADNPRALIEAERDAYAGALRDFEAALTGEPTAMKRLAEGLVERLEWNPETGELRLLPRYSPAEGPQVLVAPRGFEPLLPE